MSTKLRGHDARSWRAVFVRFRFADIWGRVHNAVWASSRGNLVNHNWCGSDDNHCMVLNQYFGSRKNGDTTEDAGVVLTSRLD